MPAQFHAAYTIQWTLSIQHQFGRGWQAQVDYIGNATRHDPMGFSFDPAVFIPGVWGAGGTGCTGIVTTGPAAGDSGRRWNPLLHHQEPDVRASCSPSANPDRRATSTLGRRRRLVHRRRQGTANYNGLVASLQHRLSSTFSLLANWTWSKCLNIEDAQGDLAGTKRREPQQPCVGLRSLRLRLSPHREYLAGGQERLQRDSTG